MRRSSSMLKAGSLAYRWRRPLAALRLEHGGGRALEAADLLPDLRRQCEPPVVMCGRHHVEELLWECHKGALPGGIGGEAHTDASIDEAAGEGAAICVFVARSATRPHRRDGDRGVAVEADDASLSLPMWPLSAAL